MGFSELKVGDKVRVVTENAGGYGRNTYRVGKTYEVLEVDSTTAGFHLEHPYEEGNEVGLYFYAAERNQVEKVEPSPQRTTIPGPPPDVEDSYGATFFEKEYIGPESLAKKPADRKSIPVYSGFLKYFPNAVKAVAHLSWVGNEQHNPGEPLHWAKEKSSDHKDCLCRHLLDDLLEGTDDDGQEHLTKVAWRAMAALEIKLTEQ